MKSLGMIETLGLAAAIQAADAACKAADVRCIGYRTVGSGLVNICFEGEISAIRTAIERGIDVLNPKHALRSLIIARPESSVVAALSSLKGKGFSSVNKLPPVKEPLLPEFIGPVPVAEEKVPNRKGHKP